MDGAGPGYDVFLSYHWRDRESVERVARAMRERDLNPFLDRWYLAAGQPWPEALEQALSECRAVAVFLGSHGTGSWQQREQYLALDRQAKTGGFPVIPVLLPGADPPLGFLSLQTWVDLRAGLDDAGALAVLEAAIQGRPPGAEAQDRITAALATLCPYRGLQPFREEDAAFFCGRENFSKMLIQAVEDKSLVAVVGASGSGKSSVVQAGLIPHLRSASAVHVWDVATLVPGDRPLHNLALALVPALEPEMTEVTRLAESNELAAHLASRNVALRDVVTRILEKQPGTDRLLLFVDQWEELYSLAKEDSVRKRFLEELLDASGNGPLTAVLTMRSDFYRHALTDRGLADRLQDAVVNLGPMTREELERSITVPAEKVHLDFEPGLVDRILDEVGDEPGNLPLLEFLLESLWEKRRGGLLHYDAYNEIKGVKGAIAERAEEVFGKLDDREQEAARRILIQMVRPGVDSADIRQRATLPRNDDTAMSVIKQLADARLVVTGRDEATGHETVEVAHEALIRHWGRLKTWVGRAREMLQTRDHYVLAAEHWLARGRNPSLLLQPGSPLIEAILWLRSGEIYFPHSVKDFVRASMRRDERLRIGDIVHGAFVGWIALFTLYFIKNILFPRLGVSNFLAVILPDLSWFLFLATGLSSSIIGVLLWYRRWWKLGNQFRDKD